MASQHTIGGVETDSELVSSEIGNTMDKIDGLADLTSGFGDAFYDGISQLQEGITEEQEAQEDMRMNTFVGRAVRG